jgi:quercetin dioxygenase-like cupin family protein
VSSLLKKAVEREWSPTDYAGIERSLFRTNEAGGRSSVVRLAAGTRFPRHTHHGTEEVLVISGKVSIGGAALEEGDYLLTSAGEEHDVVAIYDAVVFVSSQKATPVIGS